MAIVWGGYLAVGNGASVRVGLDLSYAAPGGTLDASDTQVTVTWKMYAQSDYDAWSTGGDAWSLTGGAAANGTKAWRSDNGSVALIASGTKPVNLGSTTQTFTATAQLFDAAGSLADPKVTAALSIPARPQNKPAAVTGATVARVSDTQHTVSWANNATAAAPYLKLAIERWDNVTAAWTAIITNLSPTLTSYSDKTTRADRRYRYRIRPVNNNPTAGDWAATAYISTTPAAPIAGPTARKDSAGGITVTPPALSGIAKTWDVLHAANGVWDSAPIKTGLDVATAKTWTHPTPDPSATHQYKVRAVSLDAPALAGGWSPASGAVQLIAPPNAPTKLAPQVAQDVTAGVVLSWQHNPLDTTPQTALEAEHRLQGAATWDALTGKVVDVDEEYSLPPGTWANGTSREWRVRTWGEHADPGAWSQPALVRLSQAPTVAVTSPEGAWGSTQVTATVSFFDPEGSAMSAWWAALVAADGQVLQTRSGHGQVTQVAFTVRVDDGSGYEVQFKAADGVGLWSDVASAPFVVAYALPPVPSLEARFDPEAGWTVLEVTVPAPAVGQEQVDHVRVERAEPGGWLTVADQLQPGGSAVDMIPPLGGVVHYRAVAVSALPSSTPSAPVPVSTRTRYLFFNFGPEFGQMVRVWANLKASRTHSRSKVLQDFDDRPDPVEYAGSNRRATYSLGTLAFSPLRAQDPGATYSELVELADAPAPVCLRDPEGVKEFVSTGDLDLSDHLAKPHRPVSITLTRTAWVEGEVVPS